MISRNAGNHFVGAGVLPVGPNVGLDDEAKRPGRRWRNPGYRVSWGAEVHSGIRSERRGGSRPPLRAGGDVPRRLRETFLSPRRLILTPGRRDKGKCRKVHVTKAAFLPRPVEPRADVRRREKGENRRVGRMISAGFPCSTGGQSRCAPRTPFFIRNRLKKYKTVV